MPLPSVPLDAIRQPAVLYDADGRIAAANDRATALAGHPLDGLLAAEAIRTFCHRNADCSPVNPEELPVSRALAGEEVIEDSLTVTVADGRTLDILVTASPIRKGGAITGALVVWQDITEWKEAELRLGEYADGLRRSNEELQRFAYVASHDLQEPLRSIISFSQLLERRYKGQLGQDADEYIGFIVDGGNRMQRLIADLLQVSRIETQARPLAPTEPKAVVYGALRTLEETILESGAMVTVGDLPVVMADAIQLEQIFTNLIGNALKYRRADAPPEITVSAWRVGPKVQFSVADNGIGIEAEYYDLIFEMFRRLHTHDKYEGTGIGLAVVKRIVERHGGAVHVESMPGAGSTFFFTLPAV